MTAAFAVLPLVTSCSEGARPTCIAPTLAGLGLHHRLSGPRAVGALERLHGDAELRISDAWIAHYGESTSAMVYVGRAGSRKEAQRLLDEMRRRIAEQDTPFRGVHSLQVSGRDVYLLSGQGQLHFVFRKGAAVIWLSADPPVATPVLAEGLELDPAEAGACDEPAATPASARPWLEPT